MADPPDETNTERLSFRTTRSNAQKLVQIAKSRGWLLRGRPNISKVLNYIIDKFELSPDDKDTRRKRG